MKTRKRKQKFAEVLKEKFDFDVSAIGNYVDEQSDEIIERLVLGAKLIERIQVMEGVKGSEKIKLFDMDTPLQSAENCGKTPDGAVIFTDKVMTVSPVKIDLNFCNKTLKGTWAQMLLALGARAEKENLPLEDVITAFTIKRAHLKNQNLMMKGDTTSVDPDLVHYDGFIKLWKADVLLYNHTVTGATDVTNAFARAQAFANKVPEQLLDNAIVPEMMVPRAFAQLIINNIYNDKQYANALDVKYDGSELSFILPTTQITVRSYPQLAPATGAGTGVDSEEVFLTPYEFMFFGTDLEGDMEDFWLFYEDKDEKIFFGAEWASGVQYVYGDYFGKLIVNA